MGTLTIGEMLAEQYGHDINYIPSPPLSTTTEVYDWAVEQLERGGQAGGCDAAVLDSDQYALQGIDSCSVMWVGPTLLSIESAAPVRKEYGPSISHILRLSSTRAENAQYMQLRAKYTPHAECSGYEGVPELDADSMQLTPSNLFGPFMALGISIGAAFGIHLFTKAKTTYHGESVGAVSV